MVSASAASSLALPPSPATSSPPPPPPCRLVAPATTSSSLRSLSSPRGRLFFLNPLPAVRDRKSGVGGVRAARSVRCTALPPLAELAPATSAAYGTLLFGGGIFAYARSRSKGSILGGLSGAALMAAAYYLMQNPETKAAGDALGFGSATLFSAIFSIRLAATRKLIPSGLLLGLSAGTLAVFVSAYMQDKI
uniref:Monocyte differentiation antigen CD14 n=1 Tax=Anthurium amnicola TaxID=1678845 RepID=A0A1D1XHL8_9ARAE